MKFGLTDSEFSFLMENLVQPLKNRGAQVFLFGSRSTGAQQKYSDIDILFKNKNSAISSAEIYNLLSLIEESSFPFKIDLVDDNYLADSYRNNIEKQLIEL